MIVYWNVFLSYVRLNATFKIAVKTFNQNIVLPMWIYLFLCRKSYVEIFLNHKIVALSSFVQCPTSEREAHNNQQSSGQSIDFIVSSALSKKNRLKTSRFDCKLHNEEETYNSRASQRFLILKNHQLIAVPKFISPSFSNAFANEFLFISDSKEKLETGSCYLSSDLIAICDDSYRTSMSDVSFFACNYFHASMERQSHLELPLPFIVSLVEPLIIKDR